MTRQEEIREVLTTLGCRCKAKDLAKSPTGFDDEVDAAMVELDELGVAVKVDRKADTILITEGNISASFPVKLLDKAGYAAVEPIIGGK